MCSLEVFYRSSQRRFQYAYHIHRSGILLARVIGQSCACSEQEKHPAAYKRKVRICTFFCAARLFTHPSMLWLHFGTVTLRNPTGSEFRFGVRSLLAEISSAPPACGRATATAASRHASLSSHSVGCLTRPRNLSSA